MKTQMFCWLAVMALCASPALAQFESGSDGSDGALLVPADTEVVIDLGEAADASWDTPSPHPGKGVYDADKWAVVFKYTTVTIEPGRSSGSPTTPRAPRSSGWHKAMS